jgi:dihydrolipoamide dehydrogenase
MSDVMDIIVPELGDFDQVDVVEVLVGPGDTVEAEDGLISLETDKATMDVPSPAAGKIVSIDVAAGDQVKAGDVIGRLDRSGAAVEAAPAASSPQAASPPRAAEAEAEESTVMMPGPAAAAADADRHASLLVLGAGPGGYTAAFRAADLGMDVTLVERWDTLGGVCLNVGCIPSKALLHAAKVIDEAESMAANGITFGAPQIDAERLRDWKGEVVGRLTGGLDQLAKQRKVSVVHGDARFASPNTVMVEASDGDSTLISFDQCIIAAGSESIRLPGLPDDPRIVDSTGALELAPLPKRMLVVGGGIIGLEMGCVYEALGVAVSVVELTGQLMPGADPDLVRPFAKRIGKKFEAIMLNTKVTGMTAGDDGIEVTFEGDKAPGPQTYDRVLVAVGRRPNGGALSADAAGVDVDERGFIRTDKQMRTNVPHIFAIGDIVGQPMLAHKATHEAKVAAEVAAGEKSYFDARSIPSVAYTDPEVAWVGLTETEAKKTGQKFGKAQFPWAASGRSLAMGRDEGLTKILFDEDTGRVIGGGIVGTSAGDLIAEIGLAIEMGADAADIGLTIHAHPTLSETVAMSAEAFEGTLTDLYMPKKKKRAQTG